MRYLLLGLATVLAAYGQGTWTQIMNSGGTTSESSTQFIIFNSSTTPDPVVTSSTTTSYHEPVTHRRIPLEIFGRRELPALRAKPLASRDNCTVAIGPLELANGTV